MLIDFYKVALLKAEEYLRNKGYVLKVCNKDDPDYPAKGKKEWSVVWSTSCIAGSQNIQILVAFPVTFPDEFPQVFLSKKSFDSISPIPHLGSSGDLCTFDPVESAPNPGKPGELAESFIERAIKVLDDGIARRNLPDYKDEFLAYWQMESVDKICSLLAPHNEKMILTFLPFSSEWRGYVGVIAKQLEDAKNWCDALNVKFEESKATDILYLPLNNFGYPPFPTTNAELLRRLKEHSPHSLKELTAYFKSKIDQYYVLFSVPTERGRAFGLWHHIGLSKNKKARGFRKIYPAKYMLLKHHADKLKKSAVERIDRDRLFARGGIGPSLSEDVAVSMIGCGAIGSTLAYSLVRNGLNTIDLVDPDKLSAENVARHHCGLSDIDKYKSQVLREKLRLHYPYLKCNAYDKDILHLLLNDASFLNKYSLNIVAIGRLPIEKRLNLLIQNKSITSPFLFVWVEPLLVAGHALFVNPVKSGCLECILDTDLRVKYRVVEEAFKFFKREAGCQTTYIPYPSLEIDRFVNSIAQFIMSILKSVLAESTLLTWIGDIDSFRKKGEAVAAYWASDLSYTEHAINLSSEQLCEMCSAKVSA